MPEITVLCFGTFDVMHKGHEYFLKQARSLGSRLVVGVGRDENVWELKRKEPINSQAVRLARVKSLPYVDEVKLSDRKLGTFQIIKEVRPQVIVFGHDQSLLQKSCLAWLDLHYPQTKTQTIDKLETEKIPIITD